MSAVKFVYFFLNSSKPVLTEKIFVDWPIRNIKKLTADILVFWRKYEMNRAK